MQPQVRFDRSQLEAIVREVVERWLVATQGQTEPKPGVLLPIREQGQPGQARGLVSARASEDLPDRSESAGADWQKLFHSARAEALKAELVRASHKLWQRQYVDGNGGNLSCRLNEQTVLCTPTMMSKADLGPDDLCLVTLEGRQLAGRHRPTSELGLHTAIYRTVPEAQAVVHCHPPHAMAYAVTGQVPPSHVTPEYEVFLGSVGLAPYATPGTGSFAEAVLPLVREHRAVLLSNHGVVCWAESVSTAEWYVEILDTYCWTLILARLLGGPVRTIPAQQIEELRAANRAPGREARPCPEGLSGPQARASVKQQRLYLDRPELLIRVVTDAVLAALATGEHEKP